MTRLLLGFAALGLLAGCGIPGGLERPGPMWNSAEAIRYECTRELRRGERRDDRCDQWQQSQTPATSGQPTQSTAPSGVPQSTTVSPPH